jgi:MFS family permease
MRGEQVHPTGALRAGATGATLLPMSHTADLIAVTPEWRLKDLRAARIAELPTPRRRARYWLCAVLWALGVVFAAYVAVADQPLFVIVAVIFAFAAYADVGTARQIGAQLRSPEAASHASFDEPAEWQKAGDEALQGVSAVVVSGSAGLLDIGAGIVGGLITRFLRRRKPADLASWNAATAADLLPDERRLVTSRTRLVPHGPRRVVLWLTAGLAGLWMLKGGVVTVTDQRLLFHRRSWFGRRRTPHRVQLSVSLAELEIREWHQGSYCEKGQQVLVMRRSNGPIVRMNFTGVWAEEAQSLFDVVASCSKRPPAFLAARWTA